MPETKDKKKLTKEEVRKIADLANIHIEDSELEKYGEWITDILEYVNLLDEVDASDFEYQSHVELTNVLREDEVEPSLTQDQATSGRKDAKKNGVKDGYFVIDAVLQPSE
jgi:aspartyl-tRNA(Asn)/glutamyl-tRNA(Gln) amidotransferase subunit C